MIRVKLLRGLYPGDASFDVDLDWDQLIFELTLHCRS